MLGVARFFAIGLIAACTTRGDDVTSRQPSTATSNASPTSNANTNASANANASPIATTTATSVAVAPMPPFVALPVPGFADAVVAIPEDIAATTRVVVATHGNYDRPEWSCEVFSRVFERKAFVVCPRGLARPDSPGPDDIRYTYENNQKLEREVDAALEAFRAASYARAVPKGGVVWVGFSLGAIMGVAIAARRPADFPTLVLVEGGVDRLTDEVMRKLAKGGTERVLLACAQRGCGAPAKSRAARLEALGIRAAVVDAGNIGHTYDGKVADGIQAALPELLARAVGTPR